MKSDLTTGFLYVTFGGVAALANVPILALILFNQPLRTKYPTVVGKKCPEYFSVLKNKFLGALIVDFVCFICLITSGVLFLKINDSCIPEIVASSLPILQVCLFILLT